MAINALVITGLDPGAVPGGSTILPTQVGIPTRTGFGQRGSLWGPKQDRQTGKGDCFRSGEARYRLDFIVANDNYAEEVALAA